ncbi:hypothetical protein Tco_0978743 [Tanacetum coccineum]|uniref:Monodehydroascorbate reductase n=1 Tax=Tanacetum coccineum TaxID=301880 RepID=A0ABQ5ENU6_9ASTR
MNTTQAQQKALDDALVAPADRLEFGKCNMRLKTDIKPKEATFQVVLDALALTLFYRAFLITADVLAIYMQEFWANFCPKIPGQVFEDLPLEQDILSFIRDLGHTGDITYLTDVNVDYLHQPWRAFATVINKCLSGKEIRMDKIRLSRAQILWGMFHKKNIDYVYLLWEDLLFQIKYKDAKKINKMSYPRFTKIIIDYFMFKYESMNVTSRHEDTQEEATCKEDKSKSLDVLSEVALTEAEQIKLTTKRSKKDFHVSHARGSGDGVDTQSKSHGEKGEDEYIMIAGDNDDDDGDSDDHDDDCDDERTESDRDEIPDPKLTNVDQTKHEEEENDDEFYEEEEEKTLMMKKRYTDMTIANQGASDQQNVSQELGFEQVEEDAHVTLTPVIDTQKTGDPTQSSSISSDFTSKLLYLDNPSPADNEIASLIDITAQHATVILEITSSFTITIPPPPPFLRPI